LSPALLQIESPKEASNMFELTTDADVLGLQSIADKAELYRYYRGGYRRRSRKNVCLVTANHSLNGISILNVLNNFGGW
jgi:hypothetical protein